MASGSFVPQLTSAQWRDDLQFFARQLAEQHKNAFHHAPREQFMGAVHDLDARIPELEDYQIVVGLQALAAMIGDGHTFLAAGAIQRAYPLEVFWFGRELRVVRAAAGCVEALGARLVAIGGTPIEDANAKAQSLVPQAENEWYVLNQSARQLVCADVLAALGVAAGVEQAAFTFADDTGRQFRLGIQSVAPAAAIDRRDAVDTPPLYLQRPGEPFWFDYLADSRTLYVCFRRYDGLAEHARRLFAAVDEHEPQRLVIDMRQNGGGNYTLARDYLMYPIQSRPRLNTHGHLFVLTGRATFSAAMTNVTDFRRETDAIIVGEPPGARPHGYQENYWLMLPHSGLRASVACRHYKFTDADVPAVQPDQRIDPRWADYKAGRDAVMECVVRFQRRE